MDISHSYHGNENSPKYIYAEAQDFTNKQSVDNNDIIEIKESDVYSGSDSDTSFIEDITYISDSDTPFVEDIGYKETQLINSSCDQVSEKSDIPTSNKPKGTIKRNKRQSVLHEKVKSNQFMCKLCKKTCTQKIHLDGHLLTKHKDVPNVEEHIESKIHYCEYCSFRTINTFNLAHHLSKKHKKINSLYKTKIKKLSCCHCDYSTDVQGNLILHLRTHSSVRPFSCKDCSHSFNQKAGLDKHKQTHLNAGIKGKLQNGRKKKKSALNKHKQTHLNGFIKGKLPNGRKKKEDTYIPVHYQ